MRGESTRWYNVSATRAMRSSIGDDLQPVESILQLLLEFGMCQLTGARLNDHGKVDTGFQGRAPEAEEFSDPALDAVAADGIANLAANADAEAFRVRSGGRDDQQMAGVTALSLSPNLLVLPSMSQAGAGRKALVTAEAHKNRVRVTWSGW